MNGTDGQKRSAMIVLDKIQNDEELNSDFRKDPPETLRRVTTQVLADFPRDPQLPFCKDIYAIAIWALGLLALISVIGIVVYSINPDTSNADVPNSLIAIASAVIGALAGILTPRREK